MRTTALFVLALAALPLTSILIGCEAPMDDGSSSADSDLTKRTAPKAGMGAVTLDKPSWYDPEVFKGTVQLYAGAFASDFNGHIPSGQTIGAGAQVDFAPGSYDAIFFPDHVDPSNDRSRGYGVAGLSAGTVNVVAGAVSNVKLAGLQIKTDRNIVWSSPVSLATLAATGDTIRGLRGGRVFTAAPSEVAILTSLPAVGRTASQLLPAATYELSGLVGDQTVVLEEGKLTKLPVMTTSTFDIALDPVDDAFPDSDSSCVSIEALGVKEPVRHLSAFKGAVLPSAVPVTVKSYGMEVPAKVVGRTHHYTLNRLELDDVTVTTGGGTSKVHGQVTIQVKNESGWSTIGCGFHDAITTGTGIDLPDGTYRITSAADGVSNVEEVSFP